MLLLRASVVGGGSEQEVRPLPRREVTVCIPAAALAPTAKAGGLFGETGSSVCLLAKVLTAELS